KKQIHRAKAPHCRPVLIAGQAMQPTRQNRIIVAVPIIVGLAETGAEIVDLGLAHDELRRGERVAPQTAGVQLKAVCEFGGSSFCVACQIEIEQTRSAAKIEKLEKLLAPSTDRIEPVARGNRSLRAEVAPLRRRRILRRYRS